MVLLLSHTNIRVIFVSYIFGPSHFDDGNVPVKYNYQNEIPGIITDQAVRKFNGFYWKWKALKAGILP